MDNNNFDNRSLNSLHEEIRQLTRENQQLVAKEKAATNYIRSKIDQLLTVIGTVPLKPDELDDETLLQLDPIGIISETFLQIQDHLKKTNLDLETANNDTQAIFDSVGEGIQVLNSRGEIIAYNKKMTGLFVIDEQKVIGSTCRDAVCADETSEEDCLFRMVRDKKKSVRVRSWECRGRFYEIIGTPVLDKHGELQRIVILYMDTTRRRKSEIALRDSEERFRDLFENATDMLQSVDPQGRVLAANKAWRETLGYSAEEVPDLKMFDIIHSDYHDTCRKKFKQILQDGQEFTSKAVFLTKTGEEIPVEGKVNCRFIDGKPMVLRSIFRDVTEKLKMEEELRRTQKLEAVGLLAGGIAHDFNNLLTGILGNILLAKLKSPSEELSELLENTEKASHRAQELTRQLLTFAKGGAPVKETASVVDLMQEVISFTLSGSNTTWSIEVEKDISPVEVDPGQFSQVLQNLVINADQAMPDGGVITVRVVGCKIERNTTLPLPEGGYIRIDIQDQGIGIAKEYLSRIFDPYFSTKKKGSGLGLATAYSIIRNHNGLMTVDSEQGAGTTMTIFLPSSKHIIDRRKPEAIPSLEGKGRILVMDDDDIVRKVAVQMLTHLGYEVGESCDGEEAITCYLNAMEEGHPYDAVILDLTVPGKMGGKEAITKLLEIDPQVKAIVSSGYSNDPIMAEFGKYGFSGVVPKPYSMEKLGSTVHAVLSVTN